MRDRHLRETHRKSGPPTASCECESALRLCGSTRSLRRLAVGSVIALLAITCRFGLAADPPMDEAKAISALEVRPAWLTFSTKDGKRTLVGVDMIVARGDEMQLKYLEALGQLRSLRIDHSAANDVAEVTDDMLVHLKGLSQLESLTLSGLSISGKGIEHVRAPRLVALDLSFSTITDAGLAHIQPMTQLEYLNLNDTNITDDGLRHLKVLKRLRTLWIEDTRVGDNGLTHIRDLPELTQLYLKDTKITDAGMSNFEAMTRIRDLWLADTKIGDAGLQHLARLHDLETLGLDHTQVTDAGLQYLRPLSKLREVYLERTQVTTAGVDDLKRHLPRLRIHWIAGSIQ